MTISTTWPGLTTSRYGNDGQTAEGAWYECYTAYVFSGLAVIGAITIIRTWNFLVMSFEASNKS